MCLLVYPLLVSFDEAVFWLLKMLCLSSELLAAIGYNGSVRADPYLGNLAFTESLVR